MTQLYTLEELQELASKALEALKTAMEEENEAWAEYQRWRIRRERAFETYEKMSMAVRRAEEQMITPGVEITEKAPSPPKEQRGLL